MAQGPGTKIIEERDHGIRTVNGVEVSITELVWNDTDGRSWDVYHEDGDCLTEEGSLDNEPDDETLAKLIRAHRSPDDEPGPYWSCAGCGTTYSEGDPDMIVEHVQGCDLVDGAGNPV